MKAKIYHYPLIIKETHLDLYGHVNNAEYMKFFEEARWDLITQNNYGLNKIKETMLGPVILGATLKFLKELNARDEVIIESQMVSYERKIGLLNQKIFRGKDLCCAAEFTFGLFDVKLRKLVLPTEEWLKGVGYEI